MTLKDFLLNIGVSDKVANVEFFGSVIGRELYVELDEYTKGTNKINFARKDEDGDIILSID